ncbi:MAG: NFACT family protein [Nitrososphaerota archaeon]|nr:NFACT family protein [Nitrososphaerota archaeon]
MAELSGFEVLVLAKEIDFALRGAYINNIYSYGSSQLFRFRKPHGDDIWLVVSPKKGAWVSANVAEREETSQFTSKLRGELERARFSSSTQADLDRVFLLRFEGNEERTLIVELMPPGNIIVTDGSGRILLALNEVRSETRRIVRGGVYSPPKQSRLSPARVNAEEVAKMLGEEPTLGRAIGRHVGLPRKYVSDALMRLGADDRTTSEEMAGREEEAASTLRKMVEDAQERPAPCICETPSGPELYAYRPQGQKVVTGGETVSALCDRLLLDEALTSAPRSEPEDSKRKEIEATVSKLRTDADALKAKAAKAREAAAAARGSPLEDAISLQRSVGLQPARGPASPESAASALFTFAKDLESRAAVSLESADRLEKKARRVPETKHARTRAIVRKKGEWFEKFRWFVTGEGRLAIGGRDAQSNSAILGRHMDANDTVFHADLFGSPFFVLKGGRDQTEEEAREVAQATVAFSSAWKTGLGSADAYWVSPDQVSSAAPSGEYLSRGSYSIRGKKNFIPKMMVELALGVDRDGRVTAGPEAAIRLRCEHYVVLVPHNEKSSETAKRVHKDLSGDAASTTLDEVQRALPAGGGKIIRKL